MHQTLPLLTPSSFPSMRRRKLTTVQVNLGYRCNQSCTHCHVNAGPTRTEMMDDSTIELLINYLKKHKPQRLDVTGGAPELHPRFRYLVETASALAIQVMDRCNLTALELPELEGTAEFLAQHQVEIVASLPCYTQANVDGQRGKGTFASSIHVLQKLNTLGYAQKNSGLQLHLVYNPTGPFLPPAQSELQTQYKEKLDSDFGIQFNQLFTIANMPIQRFGSALISTKQFEPYMDTLRGAHQDANLEHVMCRDTLSIDWQGYLYDCDFNQMLDMPIRDQTTTKPHLRDILSSDLEGASIATADHCYGCTAGQGSSCTGAFS